MTQPLALAMEKSVYGGDCLTHLPSSGKGPGKALFVPLVLPGEEIEAVVIEEKRNFARAEATRLLAPSPARTEPRCPYFGSCGGCQYQHALYEAQLDMKRGILRETLLRAGVTAPTAIATLAGDPWGYRNRVRFAVREDGQLAYRGRASHALVAVETCSIAAPALMSAALAVAEWSLGHPAPTPLREIEIFANQDDSEMLIALFVAETPDKETAHAWLTTLHATLPTHVSGLRMEVNDGRLEPNVVAISGRASLTYTTAGIAYRVDAGAFFQVNRFLLDDFVARVVSYLPDAKLAWDLYAGVGLFARQLASRYERVEAVEIATASREALAHNLAETNAVPIISTTLDYLRANRERREPRPDAILVDPPRAGLGTEVTQLLNAIHAPDLVYVSCDPATLARDLKALTAERYRIAEITLVDMFPQTFHIETVVHLRQA
ncbi:MAG TPA: 23S rRNA (uracil(1939)-C(5))-methyltransferase RlmD [Acidobacteriaceae bacterium]|nr:23S rRNA (uracil(1939)-C(5))-methyltransferase RlmD [Acidobacteriaceae bacterium]